MCACARVSYSVATQLEAEFNRQGLLFGGKWKMAAQNSYDICASYPIQFGIPAQINSSKLTTLAKTRIAGRMPILCWCVHTHIHTHNT